MDKIKLLGAASLAASLMAVPALAQNHGANGQAAVPSNSVAATTPGAAMAYSDAGSGGYTGSQILIQKDHNNNNNNNANNNRPSQRNPVLADNGDARASKVIGTAVFNTQDQKLGNVDDILIGKNGVLAVIATNNKKVTVPFQQLEFGDANVNGDEKVVLPNETQAKLNTEPGFYYNAANYPNANNNNGNGNGVFGNNNGTAGNATGNGPFSGGNGTANSNGNRG